MQIVFLPEATTSLRWFHRYYSTRFPAGKSNAMIRFQAMKDVLHRNPEIGRPMEGRDVRLYLLPKTPFCVIYRIRSHRIEILSVYDQRNDPELMP